MKLHTLFPYHLTSYTQLSSSGSTSSNTIEQCSNTIPTQSSSTVKITHQYYYCISLQKKNCARSEGKEIGYNIIMLTPIVCWLVCWSLLSVLLCMLLCVLHEFLVVLCVLLSNVSSQWVLRLRGMY